MGDQPEDQRLPSLRKYHMLGRSGLRVSPLCLGTMTFGNDDWGSSDEESRAIFNRFLEAGGNFVDTADLYSMGRSEELIGQFIKERGDRDSIVLATKFTFNPRPMDPNAGGNSRKHVFEAVNDSLRRLQTDYIDLYWMHTWDTFTPVEEVMETMHMLIQQGKVRYFGLSDVPAWYAARAQTIAELRGYPRIAGLQLEYSLVRRDIENEFVDLGQELGMGITPWSPLASGVLSGKYRKGSETEGRAKQMQDAGNPALAGLINDRNLTIAEKVIEIAQKIDRHPAQVALNWVTKRPGVSSTIIGARKPEQLESNLQALEFEIPGELRDELDEISKPPHQTPYMFFDGPIHGMVTGYSRVTVYPDWYWGV